jgi:3-dehydroquinate synthase
LDRLRVELAERSYEVLIAEGSLEGIGEAVRALGVSPKLAIVSNPTVFDLYGRQVEASLKAAGFEPALVTMPEGEEHKTLQWTERILGELLRWRLDRGSAVVALGGGVIGDMAGFAAAIYMRGIRFVQVPTTLLAQVDSSVGGKTGVNHPLGKNLIGAFWQPSLVWIDVGTLGSLPRRELLAGLAEVIKYGVIRDEEFFNYLGENRQDILGLDTGALMHIIRRSCEIKAEVVAEDEREAGLRAILNFGHTMGHALEAATGYAGCLHGEAVAVGMCLEAELSVRMGIMQREEAERVYEIIKDYGLPAGLPEGVGADAMIAAMELDKKTLKGELRFILPQRVSEVRVNEPVGRDVLEKFLKGLLIP